MKNYIKQVKKGLAAFMVAVLVMGSGIISPQAVHAAPEANSELPLETANQRLKVTIDSAYGLTHDNDLNKGIFSRAATANSYYLVSQDNSFYIRAYIPEGVEIKTFQSHSIVIESDNPSVLDAELLAKRYGPAPSPSVGTASAEAQVQVRGLGTATITITTIPFSRNALPPTHHAITITITEEQNEGFVYVTNNSNNTMAITTNGELWAWGPGILGDGKRGVNRPNPVKIMENVASVSNFEFGGNTYAIQTDGSLWEWGSDNAADGDGIFHLILNPVKIMENVVSVSAQSGFAHAVQTDGSLWAWGLNSKGQLGDGTNTGRNNPVMIMQNVASLIKRSFEGGQGSTHVIQTDGSLWGWGWLTDLPGSEYYTSPVRLMENVVHVSYRSIFSYILAIQTDGSLWEWRENSPLRMMENVAYAPSEGSFAIKTDGSLWAWGDNYSGQLGDGTTTRRNNPVRIFRGIDLNTQ